jgi:cytochrome c-type biogenesis protein CcmE
MKARPWIWIILAYMAFVALTIGFVVIAVKNKQPEVPLNRNGHFIR